MILGGICKMELGGFELLPYHIVLVVVLGLFFYGYSKKHILITNLSAIALVIVGLYGVIYGFPTVSGLEDIVYANGTTVTTRVISHSKDFVTEIASIAVMVLGAASLLLVNFEIWKEMNL